MSNTENNTLTFEAINYVTIPIWEYKELVTKVARYDLLQEQEKQQQAAMEAFKATFAKDMVKIGDAEKPVPVTVHKSDKVEDGKATSKKVAKPAITTEITEK